MTAKFVPAIDFGECVSSPHPPPPKKARVEIQAEEACDEFTKSEAIDFVECLPPIKSRAEIEADEFEEACVKFFEEISISDGFDIETFPDPSRILCGGMVKVVFDLEHLCSQVHRDWSLPLLYKFGCIFSLNYAISKENQTQKKKLTLEKIIKSIYRAGDEFFTTFLAKDEVTGESKIYQTQVGFSLRNAETEVEIFRERADQALQPGEDAQGVDMELFPNLPAPDAALRSAKLDIYAVNEDSYYLSLCYMSVRFFLREKAERENKGFLLVEIIKSVYGADLIFRTTFKAEDVDTDELKTFDIEVFFNMKNGELELLKSAE